MPPQDFNSPRLTEENLNELAQARLALRKIRRAVLAASIEGYAIAIFGGLSILFGITSPRDIFISLPFAVVGVIEVWGARQLRRLRPQAISILTFNQLTLAALILIYALANLYMEIAHPASASQSLPGLSDGDLQALQSAGPTAALIQTLPHLIFLLLYGSLILAAVGEATMAYYYHTRGRHLENYLTQTPSWIIAMQQQGISV